ncbi:hypothetical protein CEXT_572831, partial [Caerostris extrusa]
LLLCGLINTDSTAKPRIPLTKMSFYNEQISAFVVSCTVKIKWKYSFTREIYTTDIEI